MSWTMQQFIIIVLIGISGSTFFAVMHKLLSGQKINLRPAGAPNFPRFVVLVSGPYLILAGLILRNGSNFWWDLLSSFLVVTGFQIFLSAVGIRLELLGNNPAEVNRPDPEGPTY